MRGTLSLEMNVSQGTRFFDRIANMLLGFVLPARSQSDLAELSGQSRYNLE